jgi:4-hydroxy-L-threonine phosphate dehydrogenase PdxA
MSNQQQKPVIGVSVGDVNGIGTELIIKTFSDHRLLEFCTPLIFASNKLINFYRKFSPDINLNYQNTKDFTPDDGGRGAAGQEDPGVGDGAYP